MLCGVYDINLGLLILRLVTGLTIFLHGYNHFFGGGRLPGAGRWFDSLGIRPGILHAWVTALVETGAGLMMAIGLLTPLAGAGIVGIMAVALIVVEARNGFFIVKDGCEYVLFIAVVCAAIGATGPGEWSVDNAIGFSVTGWAGIALSFGLGVVAAVGLLAAFWRPPNGVRSAWKKS